MLNIEAINDILVTGVAFYPDSIDGVGGTIKCFTTPNSYYEVFSTSADWEEIHSFTYDSIASKNSDGLSVFYFI